MTDTNLMTAADRALAEGRSADAVRAAHRRGEGPRAVRLGGRTMRWRRDEWTAWMNSRPIDGEDEPA